MFTAEQDGITQATAEIFPQSNLFGSGFENMFRDAIAAVGNWEELTSRHYESFGLARDGNNLLVGESDISGLLYSPPFSNLIDSDPGYTDEDRPGPLANGTLEVLGHRGYLRCAIIPDRPGFAAEDKEGPTSVWTGMDVDLCRALSIALYRRATSIVYVVVEDSTAGFIAVANGAVDVLIGASYSLQSDVKEPTTNQGFTFSPAYFFGEQSEMLCLVTKQNATQWSDFVRWTLYGLIQAEYFGIGVEDNATQVQKMPTVDLFGPSFDLMFQLVVLQLGNYGDLYRRNLQSLYPRRGFNQLNNGKSPLIKALPIEMFGRKGK